MSFIWDHIVDLLKRMFMSWVFFFFLKGERLGRAGNLSPISENIHTIEKILRFMNFDGRQELPAMTEVERPDTF